MCDGWIPLLTSAPIFNPSPFEPQSLFERPEAWHPTCNLGVPSEPQYPSWALAPLLSLSTHPEPWRPSWASVPILSPSSGVLRSPGLWLADWGGSCCLSTPTLPSPLSQSEALNQILKCYEGCRLAVIFNESVTFNSNSTSEIIYLQIPYLFVTSNLKSKFVLQVTHLDPSEKTIIPEPTLRPFSNWPMYLAPSGNVIWPWPWRWPSSDHSPKYSAPSGYLYFAAILKLKR